MLKNLINNKDGASIIIVSIVVALFIIVGSVVMGFAASNASDASSYLAENRTYYVAKSVVNMVTSQLERGDSSSLGMKILNDARKKVSRTNTSYEGQNTINLDLGLPEGFAGEYQISCKPFVYKEKVLSDGQRNPETISVDISQGDLEFEIVSRETKVRYKMKIRYGYVGTVKVPRRGNVTWQGNWTVQMVDL